MKTEEESLYQEITGTYSFDPHALLEIIENEPELFQPGRRNNDMVNWYLAWRVVMDEEGTEPVFGRLRKDFHELVKKIPPANRNALMYWDINVHTKLDRLFRSYAHITDRRLLDSLWIPMDYKVRHLSK